MKSDSKTDFSSYKNGKMYSTCKECFNKKVRSGFCNTESNKSYLMSHIKNQHMQHLQHMQHNYMQHNYQPRMQWHIQQQRYNGSDIGRGVYNAPCVAPSNAACVGVSGGPSEGPSNGASENNRTLIVGPSFCGKTHLLLNKLRLIRLEDPERQIRIITRSPEVGGVLRGALKGALRDLSVEENVGDLEEYRGCCVVFGDILDSNQKLIDPFFTRGRHKFCYVFDLSQSYFDVPKKTIRNNSNIIILFQQTLKVVEHIYRDIAGFDMSYDEFKSLCREARQKYSYLLRDRLEDKNGSRYRICDESNPNYKIFNTQTDPF